MPIGNLFKRLVFATQYGEPNFLFSSELNGDVEDHLQARPGRAGRGGRTVPDHRHQAVPGGRRRPDPLDRRRLHHRDELPVRAEASALRRDQQLAGRAGCDAQVDEQVSYIRNSVKATVDAYTATVKLYDVDATDPILKAWEGVFPGLITPGSEVSPELQAHFRYPQDLFEVQRSLLAKYQVSNGTEFYQTLRLLAGAERPDRRRQRRPAPRSRRTTCR